MPSLYILAGPNGAGKSSTGAMLLLSQVSSISTPFDGDKLKMIKQREFYLEVRSYKEAGKMADDFVFATFERLYKEALSKKIDFAYEGHFTEESSWDLLRLFKQNGYQIHFYFFGLKSLELSKQRVKQRAENGGHDVHESEIERNYFGNMAMLDSHLDLIDDLLLLEASDNLLILAKWQGHTLSLSVDLQQVPEWVQKYLRVLTVRTWNIQQSQKAALLPKRTIRKSRGRKL